MLRRGPGLARTVARTAVIAGTASAVSGRVHHNQQQKWAAQEQAQAEAAYAQQAPVYEAPPPAPAPAAPAEDPMAKLTKLAELHSAGVLTDEEFAAAKAQLLGI